MTALPFNMKSLFTAALLVVACASAEAQSSASFTQATLAGRVRPFAGPSTIAKGAAIVDDTLQRGTINSCGQDSLLTYYNFVDGSGVLTGPNTRGNKEFGQKFRHKGSFHILGIGVATFNTNKTNPDIYANAYRAATTKAGLVTFVDTSTRVQSDPTPLSSFQTNSYNLINFSDTTSFKDSVIVAITVPSGVAGDTLTLFSTKNGCTDKHNDSYLLAKGKKGLLTMQSLVGFAGDLGILAIIEFDNAPLATLLNLSSATTVRPIPAQKELMVVLPGNVRGNNSWVLTGMDGKEARTGTSSSLVFGIERGELQGVYSLRIHTSAGPITKRVVFE
jgi:hypothetical protein